MSNDIINGNIQEKYEVAINQLLKKIPEYQDLELKEIQFKVILKFIKRSAIGQEDEAKTIQDTLSSIAECIAFQDKWCEKEIGKDGNFDYCEVQIEAFYYEEYKGRAISFKIPELSFEYVQE